MTTTENMTIEQYLEKIARYSDDDYGKLVRDQFKDIEGASELAMLAAPTAEELGQLKKAVAIMTPAEKLNANRLTDEQVEKLAADAKTDPANLAIFFNGYAINCRRVS